MNMLVSIFEEICFHGLIFSQDAAGQVSLDTAPEILRWFDLIARARNESII